MTLDNCGQSTTKEYSILRSRYPDCIILYQMGEFFEIRYEEAIVAARILNIALTKRGEISMCGVPKNSVEKYATLLANNFKKALIYAQIGKDGGKIAREITRIFTPGTIVDNLADYQQKYIAAVALAENNNHAVVWADISTGAVQFDTVTQIDNFLDYIEPAEIIKLPGAKIARQYYDVPDIADQAMLDMTNAEAKAYNAIVRYINEAMQPSKHSPLFTLCLDQPLRCSSAMSMQIDTHSLRNMEILTSPNKSLYDFLKENINTAIGKRAIKQMLINPSKSRSEIGQRLDRIEKFYQDYALRNEVIRGLKQMPDLERAAIRVANKRGKGADLISIKRGLVISQYIGQLLSNSSLICKPALNLLQDSVLDSQGEHVIKSSFHPMLQEMRNITDNSDKIIEELTQELRKRYGIPQLRITSQNNGYSIEVPKDEVGKINGPDIIHRQSLAHSVRLTDSKVREFEKKLHFALVQSEAIEQEIIETILQELHCYTSSILSCARNCGKIDLASGLADLAITMGYTRPSIDESTEIIIENGRHPILESFADCTSNDTALSREKNLWVLTAPNMSGKSVFLRQNALIVLMAHIGSFVPATHARIGIVDQIFCRIGTADNINAGHSTFMQEMLETAIMAQKATGRSLVIIDELGRGTATRDGSAIALSIIEFLHDNIECRSLIATHYHEIIPMLQKLPKIAFYTFGLRAEDRLIVFERKIQKGICQKSCGILVAQLAGMPDNILSRAEEIMASEMAAP